MDCRVVVRSELSVVTIGPAYQAPVSLSHPSARHPRRRTIVNIQDLLDDAKRETRWPDGVASPHCSSDSVIRDGRDDTQPNRQRYGCPGCRQRFDALTGTISAGHHRPPRTKRTIAKRPPVYTDEYDMYS